MDIIIPVDATTELPGILTIPEYATGIVLFAHGSGSSRLSPRNTFVATELNNASIATLLIDLLTEDEDSVYETRFDIDLLTQRLGVVAQWLSKNEQTQHLPLGLFGASTGAASALNLAVSQPNLIHAVVSRGGRPDMSLASFSLVQTPTLLIVGGNDTVVTDLNQQAYEQLLCEKEIAIIPGATHLFEEPGALEQVSEHAIRWFIKYLK
ncbi:TPA: alpha/beta hydrolase [Candidatus Wolfebacteria bacterium]|nr:alpha/beta hydrolase [Candidatus Wolfebacteria bacterium]